MLKFMPALTSAVLALFVGYAFAWYRGSVEGNFALVLLIASVVTGLYWLAERFYFLPQRQKAVLNLQQHSAQRQAELEKQGITKTEVHSQEMLEAKDRLLMQPWWLDWTAGLFPVIITVFLLRSFLFEPFKIPSGSMIPTLQIGDLILVNKFAYGVRLPVINHKIIEVGHPQRGDVMVFRYPLDPNKDYIKRVIGVPGDEISYLNKKLKINGQPLSKDVVQDYLEEVEVFDPSMGKTYARNRYTKQFQEVVPSATGEKTHKILNYEENPAAVQRLVDFPFLDNCGYSADGVVCKVPEGHYFMMGDNRDNSQDSRYWGFVPEKNIVGKAFFVWMNFGNLWRGDFSHLGGFQ
jgi:signal peptidase I